MLRARESFLRERAEEARTEQLANLRGERGRLNKDHGDNDPKIGVLDRQIADLEAGRAESKHRKGRGQADVMIESLERSLEGVESMRTRSRNVSKPMSRPATKPRSRYSLNQTSGATWNVSGPYSTRSPPSSSRPSSSATTAA